MNKSVYFFITLLTLLAAPLPSGSAEKPPEPPQLLRKTLSSASIPYEGHVVVTHWNGATSKSEELRVKFDPPNKYRWKFLNPDGTTQRLVESDGENEWVWVPKNGRMVRGDATKSSGKRMGADAEFNLLLSNYTLSDLLTDTVAGRDVWMMELRPKKDGKPHQQLWIDKKSGVVLENKRYRPQDQYAVVSRFVRFSTNQPGSAPQKKREKEDDLADQKRKAVEHGLDPDFLSQDDWEQATGRKFLFPDSLPHGFSFESIDFFPIGNDMVSHVRYIDGLVVLSVFETSRPVRIPKITRAGNQDKDFQTTHIAPFSLPESVFQRRVDDRYFIFMSDTSEEFLKAVADSLK